MQFVRNLLIEQRKRAVGSLMGHIETAVYPRLTVGEQKVLREKVLTTLSAYHDVCLDILKSSVADGTVVNEEALQMLSDIHSQVGALRRETRRGD